MPISKNFSRSFPLLALVALAWLTTACDTGTRQQTCILGHHTRQALDEADRSLQRLSGKASSLHLSDALVRGEIDFLGTRLHEFTSEDLRATIEAHVTCDPQAEAPCASRYNQHRAGRINAPRFFEWAAAYTRAFSNVNLVDYQGTVRTEHPEYRDARELWQDLSTLARGLSEIQQNGMQAFEGTRPASRLRELRMLIRRIRQNSVSEHIEFGCAAADIIEGNTPDPSSSGASGSRHQSEATRAEREQSPEEPVRRRSRDAGPRSYPTDAAW